MKTELSELSDANGERRCVPFTVEASIECMFDTTGG